jgi:hypothetical protein
VVVRSVPCRVSSELHAGGRRVMGIVAKGTGSKANITPDGPEEKRAHVVFAKGCEIVGPGYTDLSYRVGRETVGSRGSICVVKAQAASET